MEPFAKVDNALMQHGQEGREQHIQHTQHEREVLATGDPLGAPPAKAHGRVAIALEQHQAMLDRLATAVDELERIVQPVLASAFPPLPPEAVALEPGSEFTSCVNNMTQVARNVADRLVDIIARVEL